MPEESPLGQPSRTNSGHDPCRVNRCDPRCVNPSEPGCVNPVDARTHRASERDLYAASTGPTRAGSPQTFGPARLAAAREPGRSTRTGPRPRKRTFPFSSYPVFFL